MNLAQGDLGPSAGWRQPAPEPGHWPLPVDQRSDAAVPRRLDVHRLSWPAHWSRIFGREAPLIVEVGFGRGEFLFHLAQQHPEANVIGIEVSNRSLASAERRILAGEAPTVRVIHGAAETALVHLFQPASIDAIHVNFPDPWFKTRHADRRLLRSDVASIMTDRLVVGGHLYVATDIRDYAEMTDEVLGAEHGLSNDLEAPWVSTIDGRVETKYERRARDAGRDRHYFRYVRTGSATTAPPTIEELPMPHMILQGEMDVAAIHEAFEPVDTSSDDVHVSFLSAFRDGDLLLVDTFVREPTIAQRCGLIVRRRQGSMAISLGMIGLPRPTAGVHIAVANLGAWIANLSDQVTVDRAATSLAAHAVDGLSAADPDHDPREDDP